MAKWQARFVASLCLVLLVTFVMSLRQFLSPALFHGSSAELPSVTHPLSVEVYYDRHAVVNVTEYLPSDVIDSVQRFVFFVGYARSGHSIVASILDAHPNVVLSHEYSLFHKWTEAPKLHSNKTWLYSSLYQNSRYSSADGLRTSAAKKKGYSLAINGWWQGKYNKQILVIGDKSGGKTAQVYRKKHSVFRSLYWQLQQTIGSVPISVFHVLRNPYDNIATMLLYNLNIKKHLTELSISATNKYVNDKKLTAHIISYFKQVQSVMDMIHNMPGMDVIELHNIDMIANPRKEFERVCSHLTIECGEDYLQMCEENIYPSESRTRDLVHWSDENVELVASNIRKYKSLLRYQF